MEPSKTGNALNLGKGCIHYQAQNAMLDALQNMVFSHPSRLLSP